MQILMSYFSASAEVLRSLISRWTLLVALAKRDITDEYVQHKFALAWTFITPTFTVLVYLMVFTVIWPTRVQSPEAHGTDAIIYLMSGILPWLTISQSIGRSMTSVVNNSSIVKQMAFPLELLPLKSLFNPLVFMLVSLGLIVVYAAYLTNGSILLAYSWGLPALIFLTTVMLAGLGMLTSALQVFFRDTKEFVGMFLSIGLFLHPVLYLPDLVPASIRWFIYLSPFTYMIECWRDILFYGRIAHPLAWLGFAGFAILIFVLGSKMFMGSKSHFGDVL
jgi:lipopolysaccharide transport system permease protein